MLIALNPALFPPPAISIGTMIMWVSVLNVVRVSAGLGGLIEPCPGAGWVDRRIHHTPHINITHQYHIPSLRSSTSSGLIIP